MNSHCYPIYRCHQLFNTIQEETKIPIMSSIKYDFICLKVCMLILNPDKLVCKTLRPSLFSLSFFRVDGGVCKNDFVMQLISTMTRESIDRPVHTEMSCIGAAFLAGLAAGK